MEPRSLCILIAIALTVSFISKDIMSKDCRFNCTHGIDAGPYKIFEGKKIDRMGAPRVSLIAAEMFQPPVISYIAVNTTVQY